MNSQEQQQQTTTESPSDGQNDTSNDPQLDHSRLPHLFFAMLLVAVAVSGVTGNLITALVFGRRANSGTCSGRSSISVLVTGLALVDAVLLNLSGPLFATLALQNYMPLTVPLAATANYMVCFLYPWATCFQTASVWTLSIITVERYLAVRHPFVARSICTSGRALCGMIGVIAGSIVYNIPRFFEHRIVYTTFESSGQQTFPVAQKLLRENMDYVRIYCNWLYFVFVFALPFAILLLGNGSVAFAVRSARLRREALSRQQTKEQGTAVMMIMVALVFLVCNVLAFITNAMEAFGVTGAQKAAASGQQVSKQHSTVFYLLVDLNNLLVMTHCSLNFLVYYHFSERFRHNCRLLCPLLFCGRRRHGAGGVAMATAADGGSSFAPVHSHSGHFHSRPTRCSSFAATSGRRTPTPTPTFGGSRLDVSRCSFSEARKKSVQASLIVN